MKCKLPLLSQISHVEWKFILLLFCGICLSMDIHAQDAIPEIVDSETFDTSDTLVEFDSVYDENEYYGYWLDSFPLNEKTEVDSVWLGKWQKNKSFRYANDTSYFRSGNNAIKLPQINPPNWKKSISWILIILVLLLFVYWLNRNGKFILFKPSTSKLKEIPSDFDEVSQPDHHLEKAIRESDYRSAVRYLYLILLGDLENKGYIKKRKKGYAPDISFSNKESNTKKNFDLLSRIYQYIWYGAYDVSHENFVEIQALFQSFQQSLHRKS